MLPNDEDPEHSHCTASERLTDAIYTYTRSQISSKKFSGSWEARYLPGSSEIPQTEADSGQMLVGCSSPAILHVSDSEVRVMLSPIRHRESVI